MNRPASRPIRAAFGAALALSLLQLTPAMARTAERTLIGTTAPVPTASATIDCGGGKKITISSGGSGGSCTTDNTGPGGTPFAVCRKEGGGAVATANCTQGCTAVGVGTCSTVN